MNEVTRFHIENEYFVKAKRSDKMNAIVVNIPKNLLLNSPEKEFIYEIEKNKVNVYSGGAKVSSINCREHSIRMIVFADIIHNVKKTGIPTELIAAYDENGSISMGGYHIIQIIDPPKRKSDKDLEDKLISSFQELIKSDEVNIEESIKSSFEEIVEIYVKGIHSNEYY